MVAGGGEKSSQMTVMRVAFMQALPTEATLTAPTLANIVHVHKTQLHFFARSHEVGGLREISEYLQDCHSAFPQSPTAVAQRECHCSSREINSAT